MNEVKLKRIIQSFYEINRLSDKRMIGLRKLIQNQEKRIELLTKQVNHLILNQVVRPDKIIKIPKVIK